MSAFLLHSDPPKRMGAGPADSLDLFADNPAYAATCKFEGLPPPDIEWYHNGDLLFHAAGVTEISATSAASADGATFLTTGTLTLPSPAVSQTGVYQCVGKNRAGMDSASWAVSIRENGEI